EATHQLALLLGELGGDHDHPGPAVCCQAPDPCGGQRPVLASVDIELVHQHFQALVTCRGHDAVQHLHRVDVDQRVEDDVHLLQRLGAARTGGRDVAQLVDHPLHALAGPRGDVRTLVELIVGSGLYHHGSTR